MARRNNRNPKPQNQIKETPVSNEQTNDQNTTDQDQEVTQNQTPVVDEITTNADATNDSASTESIELPEPVITDAGASQVASGDTVVPVVTTSEAKPEENINILGVSLDQAPEETVVQTPAPVNPSVVLDPRLTPPYELPASVISVLATIKEPTNISIIKAFFDYAKEMAPGRQHDDVSGGRHQANLLRIMLRLINQTGGEFTSCFTVVLALFHAGYNGAFGEKCLNRFFTNSLKLSSEDGILLMQLNNLFIAFANPVTRASNRNIVDINKTLSNPKITERGRQLVANFLNA